MKRKEEKKAKAYISTEIILISAIEKAYAFQREHRKSDKKRGAFAISMRLVDGVKLADALNVLYIMYEVQQQQQQTS